MLPGIVAEWPLCEPRQTLEFRHKILRRQPPIVGDYCQTPRSGRADWPCCYRASTCTTGTTTCPRCRFHFCDYHLTRHVRKFVIPPDYWRVVMQEVAAGLTAGKAAHRRVPFRHTSPDSEAWT